MVTAVYAGSFDPITNGHIDILIQASSVFERVVVAVANNGDKTNLLSVNERVELIKKSIAEIKNVEVKAFDGLTANFAKKEGAKVLIRGLRNSVDFDYEMPIAYANNNLNSDLKTVFFISRPENNFISSSVVRDILKNGGDISKFVPKSVFEYLKK